MRPTLLGSYRTGSVGLLCGFSNKRPQAGWFKTTIHTAPILQSRFLKSRWCRPPGAPGWGPSCFFQFLRLQGSLGLRPPPSHLCLHLHAGCPLGLPSFVSYKDTANWIEGHPHPRWPPSTTLNASTKTFSHIWSCSHILGGHIFWGHHSTHWKWKSLSHDELFETPWATACQASLSMEFSRPEHWSG